MIINKINDEITAFIFDDISGFETAVYLINKPNRYYLIDTYCGADSMRAVLSYIEQLDEAKRLVVINSHHHWDHTWGNCLFKDRTIIGHNSCYTMMDDNYEEGVINNQSYIMGNNEKTLPNLTFQSDLFFQDDDIELFYSPGHTKDCISIFDHEKRVLIVGDNLEKPLIYIEDPDVARYLRTLENYLDYQPKTILASHSMEVNMDDLLYTIEYLKKMTTNPEFELDDDFANAVHRKNKGVLAHIE